MIRRIFWTTALSTLVLHAGEAVDGALYTLDPMVTTANRIEQESATVGISHEVVTGMSMEARQLPDVGAGLQEIPGVFLRKAGGAGAATTLNIRGNRDQDSLIRVDYAKGSSGVITGFTPFLAYAQPYNLEQVEVIPGPQSVLYGSDTMGGVVTLITRRGSGPPALQASSEAGSFSTLRGALVGNGSTERLDYSFHGAWTQTDNDRPMNGYRNFDFSGRIDARLSKDWESGFMTRGHRAEYQDPPVPDLFIGAAEVQTANTGMSAYLSGVLSGSWTTRATVSWFQENYDGNFDGFEYLGDSQTWLVDWENNLEVSESYRIISGVSVEHARQKDNFFADGFKTSTHSGFYLHQLFQPTRPLTFSLGLRYDWIQRFDDPFTWRAAASWTLPNEASKFRLAGGNAFRAPNVYQLFSSFAGAANPDLRPEQAHSWEIGYEHSFSSLQAAFSLTAFYNDIEDLIIDVDPDPFVVRAENRDTAKTYGVEATWTARPLDVLELALNYTWMRAESTDTTRNPALTEDRLNLPRQQVNLDVRTTPVPGVTLGTGLLYIDGLLGNHASFFDPPDIRETSYTVVRLYGRWSLNRALSLTGRVENLLDAGYEPTPGYPANGIGGYLGLVWDI